MEQHSSTISEFTDTDHLDLISVCSTLWSKTKLSDLGVTQPFHTRALQYLIVVSHPSEW